MLTEQALAAATNAAKKAIKPFAGFAAGEISGIIGDQLRFQRWKNATRILDRAKEFCAKNKIPVKAVPVKFIIPFLDAASLEDAPHKDKIGDLWASLLASNVTNLDAKSYVFIEKLRALSSNDAKELSKFVRGLLKEKNPDRNLFRDPQYDADSWNIDVFEEFRFHFDQYLRQTTFRFKDSQPSSFEYSITPEPTNFIRRYLKSWPAHPEDFFTDLYGWQIFNSEGFYGGASNSDAGNSKFLSATTIDTLSALGLIQRQVQTFRIQIARPEEMELRFDVRLGALTTLGFQFLRATHINEFSRPPRKP